MPMLPSTPISLTAFGLVIGIFIGLTGLGGGAVVVPLLVLLYGFDQKTAQGTSLSVILSPLQLPALYNYSTEGFIKWKFLLWMAPGVLAGSFIGSWIAKQPWVPQEALRLSFGMLLVYVGSYMLFSSLGSIQRGFLYALISTAVVGIVFGTMKLLARSAAT